MYRLGQLPYLTLNHARRDLEATNIMVGMEQVIPPPEELIIESVDNPTVIQFLPRGHYLWTKVLSYVQ